MMLKPKITATLLVCLVALSGCQAPAERVKSVPPLSKSVRAVVTRASSSPAHYASLKEIGRFTVKHSSYESIGQLAISPTGRLIAVKEPGASDFPSSTAVYSTAGSTRHPSRLIVCTYPRGVSFEVKPKYSTQVRMGDDIRNPVFSPDGKRILISANRVNADGTTTKAVDSVVGLDLWTVDLQSGRTVPLTLDACGYDNYSWSPDGSYICSISYNGVWDEHPMADSGQNEYIYLWNAHKPVKKLIGLDAVDYGWSSDSKRVYHTGDAYSIRHLQNRRSSFIYADIKRGKSFLFFSSDNDLYSGRWSPKGGVFAFCEWNKTGYGISILHDGKKTFLNTELPLLPEWSPDNKKIAFFESVPHQEGGEYLNKLIILDVLSGKTLELWSTLGEASVLGWTKDSQWVVATRYRSLAPNWQKELVASPVDNMEKLKILCSPSEQVTSFDWHEVW